MICLFIFIVFHRRLQPSPENALTSNALHPFHCESLLQNNTTAPLAKTNLRADHLADIRSIRTFVYCFSIHLYRNNQSKPCPSLFIVSLSPTKCRNRHSLIYNHTQNFSPSICILKSTVVNNSEFSFVLPQHPSHAYLHASTWH